jgi:transcriptional regulator with XRE-family HTH domain
MAMKGEDPEVLRLVVGFLRFFVDQTQSAFGEASGLSQKDVSRYEAGLQKPTEKNLRRMAAVAGVPWAVVGHLRRFYGAMLPMIRDGSGGSDAQAADDRLERVVLEPVLLALATYRAEEQAEAEHRQAPSGLHDPAG